MTIGDKKSMTKKAYKEKQKSQRVTNGFNMGIRDMASEKYPTRAKSKEDLKKLLDNAEDT